MKGPFLSVYSLFDVTSPSIKNETHIPFPKEQPRALPQKFGLKGVNISLSRVTTAHVVTLHHLFYRSTYNLAAKEEG
jgi:hypothetical protein